MWLDSDMAFTPSHFQTLLDHLEANPNYHLLSGMYLLEDRVRYAAHWLPTSRHQGYLTPADQSHFSRQPFAVKFTGLGFMLVRFGVFETLDFPWFRAAYRQENRVDILEGEDEHFCHRARRAGFATWLHPQVIVGHEKPQLL